MYEASVSAQGYGSIRLSEYSPYPDSSDKVFALPTEDEVAISLFVHDSPPTTYELTMYVTAAPCSEHRESVWIYNVEGITARPFLAYADH